MTDTHFVRGAAKIAKRIRTIQARTQIALHSGLLEDLLLRRIKDRFERQVDPDGRPWPRAAASTLKRKTNPKLLQRSGTLLRSIAIIRVNNRGLAVATGAGFRIGVTDPEAARYGRFHQFGIGVPQRRFLGIGELDRKAVDSLLRRVILGAGE